MFPKLKTNETFIKLGHFGYVCFMLLTRNVIKKSIEYRKVMSQFIPIFFGFMPYLNICFAL